MSISVKLLLTLLGSAIGSAISLAFTPAMNHRDACVRLGVCFASTACCAPATTRGVVRWLAVTEPSIPDVTLAVAFLCGLVSWWAVAAVVRIAQSRSEDFVEQGLAALLPRKRDHRKAGRES